MTNEERTQRITTLSRSIIDFFETLLPDHQYTAAELYIACEYTKRIAAKTLGKDAVNQINENFWIIDPEDYHNA